MHSSSAPYNPHVHHRRSTRLREWDYAWPWWYFVTVVTKDRLCTLGEVRNGWVSLSDIGKAAEECWNEIPVHHTGIELDGHIIMPNHVHGIIIINDSPCRDVQLNVPTRDSKRFFPTKREAMSALSAGRHSLSVVVRTFKAAVTTRARKNNRADFAWQARFHDHIIRNELDLLRTRVYIMNNSLQWELDEENVKSL